MLVNRTSQLTGIYHSREINVTPEALAAYERGQSLAQDMFPDLSADDREFIITGVTPEEWAEVFPPEAD